MQQVAPRKNRVRKPGPPIKKEIRFVGVTFDDSKIKDGESQINSLLSQNFFVMNSYQTQTGVVFEMGRALPVVPSPKKIGGLQV